MKARLATVWLGGCSGCHMSFLDLDEFLLELAREVDLVFSPLMDVKRYPERVDICLVEGAICNEDHLELITTVRRNTRTVIALGDCAVTGNVTAIRNQLGASSVENVLECAYLLNADVHQRVPDDPTILPRLLPRVRPLHELIRVDYHLPGCPPSAGRIRTTLTALLKGETPQLDPLERCFG
jgi:NAD-reducing hydrogenase small subunit